MPEGTGRLLQCGPITDFSLMRGLNIFANGGRQIHTSHRGSFLCNLNFLLYLLTVYILVTLYLLTVYILVTLYLLTVYI